MRWNCSDRHSASVLTISVLASPGTPSRMQCPRAKIAIINCSTTRSCPTTTRAICCRSFWCASLSRASPARSASCSVSIRLVPLFWSTLINRKEFIGQLQNDEGNGSPVRLADAVSFPRSVSFVLHRKQMVADGGKVLVPVFVAGKIEGLGRIKLAIKTVAVPVPAVAPSLETVPDVVETTFGDRCVVLAGVVQRGDGRGRNRQPGATPRTQRIHDAPLGGAAPLDVADGFVDGAARDE